VRDRLLLLAAALLAGAHLAPAAAPGAWWSDGVEQALARARDNRPELERALAGVPEDQREGMAFLVANMPDGDLRSLKADFLLANCGLAYRARREVPWGADVPEDVFLNDVLPYANLDERRDAWRRQFHDLCMPIVKGCKTPSEAAVRLNAELFKRLNVRYSTQRKAPNQSPGESIESGKASCTGLSIVLCDACRAVAVPARLAGTPLWADRSGNHTWVEIWDGGWHFTGACEPDPRGLDRGWFAANAARARKDSPEHAIYAASFRRGRVCFPLAWAPGNRDVPAENVTDRYAKQAPAAGVAAARSAEALKALRAALAAGPKSLAEVGGMEFARQPLTRADAAAARELLWKAHAALIERDRAREVGDRLLRDGDREMPFFSRTFGTRPAGGRSLWISLHGGGGAPGEVNDRQWENQKKLYAVEEGIYLAPRAPTDTWNLWHEAHVDRLLGRLVEDLVVLEGVDPDRVYLLGYSAGGDGVYQLAPRMADYWAAAAMMAGHPNGVSPLSLRNVPFALQVGADDSAYGRNKVGREYGAELDRLRGADPGGYTHFVKIHEGKGHWMGLEDRAALPWMARFTRDPTPGRVVWKQTGTPHERSYWLAVPPGEARVGSLVVARRDGQSVEITAAEGVGRLIVRFDDRTADLDRPVAVRFGGKELFGGTAARTVEVMVKTLAGRGDPGLVFDAEVSVALPAGG
jgi:poly(3-hydroxybutyrate) depolymerase